MFKDIRIHLREVSKMTTQAESVLKEVSQAVREAHTVHPCVEVEKIYNVLKHNDMWFGRSLTTSKPAVKEVVLPVEPPASNVASNEEVEQISVVEVITSQALQSIIENDSLGQSASEYLASDADPDDVGFDNLDMEDADFFDYEADRLDDGTVGSDDIDNQDNFVLPNSNALSLERPETPAPPVTPEPQAVPEPPVQESKVLTVDHNIALKQIQLGELETTLNSLLPKHINILDLFDVKKTGQYLKPNLQVVDADTTREQLYGENRKDRSNNVYGTEKRRPVADLYKVGAFGGDDWKEVNIMNSYLPMWIKTLAMHIKDVLDGKTPKTDGVQTHKEVFFGKDFRSNFPSKEQLEHMAADKAERYGVVINLQSKSAVAIFLAHIYAINRAEEFCKTNRWVKEMGMALKKLKAEGHGQLVNDYMRLASECMVIWMGMDPNRVTIGNPNTILLMVLGISGATTRDQYKTLPGFLQGAV
jgi:hypothetical protein